MTKEEAIDACRQHAADVNALGAVLAMSGISFALVGEKVEEGLGLPKDSLALSMRVVQQQLISALSEYAAVLENAAKGQLTQVTEEWSEILDN